jgi:hypothetical protein
MTKRFYLLLILLIFKISLIYCQITYELRLPSSLYTKNQKLYFDNYTFCSKPKIDSVINAIHSYDLEVINERPMEKGVSKIRFINSTDSKKIGSITIIDSIASIVTYWIVDKYGSSDYVFKTIKKDSFTVNLNLIKQDLDDFKNQLDFWQMKSYIETNNDDCLVWIIECAEKDKYHAIYRECPDDRFIKISNKLLRICKLDR